MINFESKITNKVLGYYFSHSHKRHYINELSSLLELDAGNLFRKLKEFEAEGILKSEMMGNQRYFFLNEKYPLLKELKKTYEVKYGIIPFLEKKLSHFRRHSPELKEAYIFGSFARKRLGPESDIDLLLVGEHSSLALK
ncbi:MAG: nucleotidyltransferase domain-containing protein, partial [Candidatus Pacebacteria bacterium]|nr:nucleotidyltransferase domain-containing protein [Candidatus Paceibacterota bacterium]